MAIIVDENKQLFTIHTKTSTYQMKVSEYGHLLHIYYGNKLEHMDLSYLVRGVNRGFSGTPYEAKEDRPYSLDTYPQEYSTYGVGDYRSTCLSVEHEDGSQALELIYESYQIYDGKYKLEGLPAVWAKETEAQTLEITLKDKATGVKVLLYYGVLEYLDVITRACKIYNGTSTPIYLNKALSCCVDFLQNKMDLLSFHGRHAMERVMQRKEIEHGKLSIGSIRGTSSHQQNPFVILCDNNAGETYGNCYGASFVYSGNFLAEAEVDQINHTRFVMGIHPEGFRYYLEPQEEFVTPEVVFVYSNSGLEQISLKYHDLYRNHLIRSKFIHERKPVLLNNWEATEFHFTEEKLVEIAKGGKEIGVELFVMDDGWFGKRDSDTSGLGDWFCNMEKLPSGVEGLAEKIHGLGMKFGIWIEPEMISEDSNLYRNHPEWCLKIPNRTPNVERYQLVLDMSRPDVREYLYDSISQILEIAKVDYVKWDMNRNLSDVWSQLLPANRQGEASHRYVLGVYELMERLITNYPNILWEGCSGGGGRFDAGILYYMPQIWCSDDTDAIERISIQYGTSFAYPISSIGSHVSVVPNQQTGRTTTLDTRATVAMSGTFGYEMDIRTLSEEEKERCRQHIEQFKMHYNVIQYGDYYRLTNPLTEEIAAWQFVDKEGKESFVSVVGLHVRANAPFNRILLRGLNPTSYYTIDNGEELYLGDCLMKAGMNLPILMGDYPSKNFYLKEVRKG